MKKIKITFILICLIFQVINSQDYKFGEISKEELAESSYINDQSAEAAILYKEQKTYYMAGELITEVHKRIKIYNKEGFNHATQIIDLFRSRNDMERVKKIKAFTFNLDNGKIVKTSLEKDQIFETESNYNYNQVKFTMPNVKEGCILEIKYEIWSPFIWNIDEFKFQYEIPVKILKAELRTPKGFNFNHTFKGFIDIYPSKTIKMDNRLGMEVEVNQFHLSNVPALKEENYVDNIQNYRSGVMFELVSYKIGGNYKSFAQSWQDVARMIGSSNDYKNELDKTNSFDDDLDVLLEGVLTQEDKMKTIFKYVKDNLTWNGYDGKYFYNGIRKTLKEKKGNVADINLTLVAMLRFAGLKANPLILSTKDNFIPLFPTIDRLNYVVAYVEINDESYFLDATEEFTNVNIMPIKNYNWQGILVDNPNLRWNLIEIKQPKKAVKLFSLNGSLNEEGELSGKINSRYTNHAAYEIRNEIKNMNLDDYLLNIESKFGGIEISNFEIQKKDEYEGYVSEKFDFQHESASQFTNDRIFLVPLSFFKVESNPFKSEYRKYPIDFGYPSKTIYKINISIPENYIIESAPESVIYKLPENIGQFKYICKYNESFLQLSVDLEFNKAYISSINYPYLKEFIDQIINKEAEQIILTKK